MEDGIVTASVQTAGERDDENGKIICEVGFMFSVVVT